MTARLNHDIAGRGRPRSTAARASIRSEQRGERGLRRRRSRRSGVAGRARQPARRRSRRARTRRRRTTARRRTVGTTGGSQRTHRRPQLRDRQDHDATRSRPRGGDRAPVGGRARRRRRRGEEGSRRQGDALGEAARPGVPAAGQRPDGQGRRPRHVARRRADGAERRVRADRRRSRCPSSRRPCCSGSGPLWIGVGVVACWSVLGGRGARAGKTRGQATSRGRGQRRKCSAQVLPQQQLPRTIEEIEGEIEAQLDANAATDGRRPPRAGAHQAPDRARAEGARSRGAPGAVLARQRRRRHEHHRRGTLPAPVELTGTRKAAILTLMVGEDIASQIFKHLGEEEIERIAREVATLGRVPARAAACRCSRSSTRCGRPPTT